MMLVEAFISNRLRLSPYSITKKYFKSLRLMSKSTDITREIALP